MSDCPPSSPGSRPGTTLDEDIVIIRIPQHARLSPSVMQLLAGLTNSRSDNRPNPTWPPMGPSDEGQSSQWQTCRLSEHTAATSVIRRDELEPVPSSPPQEGLVQGDLACGPAPAAHTTARPRAREPSRGIRKAMNYLRMPGEPPADSKDTSSIWSVCALRRHPNFYGPQTGDQSKRRVAEEQTLYAAGLPESPRALTPSSPLEEGPRSIAYAISSTSSLLLEGRIPRFTTKQSVESSEEGLAVV